MIRLEGSPEELRAVSRIAAGVLRRDEAAWAVLVRHLPGLRGHAVEVARGEPTRVERGRTVGWWVLLGLGLTGLLGSGAMLDPPGRKNLYADPQLSADTAAACGVAAAALLAIVLVLRVPGGRAPRTALAVTVVTDVFVALLVGYRLLVGTGDSRDFTDAQLERALPCAILAVVVAAAVALRLRRARSFSSDPEVSASRAAWVERRAHELGAVRTAPTTLAAWRRELDRTSADPHTVEQAGAMSPAEWLVAAFVDPTVDVVGLLRSE
ncbi:hypothetical protein GCM10028801_20720 [Nocardioides maradonensis]